MTQTTKKPSVLVILRRVYLDITGNHCAAKLIEYFKHWAKWKEKNQRTDWIYMPLRQIHADLMGEHSLHVIRAAIALLEKLGFIKRRNNPGNGQDKTHQYQLQETAIAAAIPETRTVQSESPMLGSESSEFTVETYTQITTIDIENKNITPTKQECVEEKSFPQEPEPEPELLLEKHEDRLKTYAIYRLSRSGNKLIPNPKMEPVLQALAKVPADRAERSILAFIDWFKKQDATRIKDRYKALANAIRNDWRSAQ